MVKPCGKHGTNEAGQPCLDRETIRTLVEALQHLPPVKVSAAKKDTFSCEKPGPPPITPLTIRPALSARQRALPVTHASVLREMALWLTQKQDHIKEVGEVIAYTTALERFVDLKLAQHPQLTQGPAQDLVGVWIKEFEDATDIPTIMEPMEDEVFGDFRDAAQGPLSTTCGVYVLFSLFQQMGRLEGVLARHGVYTFGALEQLAAQLRMEFNSYGTEGLWPEHLMALAADGPWGNGVTLVQEPPEVYETFNVRYPYGAIFLVNTDDGGSHYLHVLAVNAAERSIRYYDPSGFDGIDNVQNHSFKNFFQRFTPQQIFAPKI